MLAVERPLRLALRVGKRLRLAVVEVRVGHLGVSELPHGGVHGRPHATANWVAVRAASA